MATLELNSIELPERIRNFIAERRPQYPNPTAVLIPALMECQKYYGKVTPEAAKAVSDELGVPYAEVQSVVSFYTMLLRQPVGEYVISLCRTWNCSHGGTPDLTEHFVRKYGTKVGEVTPNGKFTLMHVECLADCHNAPSSQFLRFGGDFEVRWCNNLTIELFDQVLEDIENGVPDALRERLVRVEDKPNPPDDKKWVWIVTTNNQYPAWVEDAAGGYTVHDGYGKLAGIKESNPKLHAELQVALKGK